MSNRFKPGQLVYFKFRGQVGAIMPPPNKSEFPNQQIRWRVLVIASPKEDHALNGLVIAELEDNLSPFNPFEGAHLLPD